MTFKVGDRVTATVELSVYKAPSTVGTVIKVERDSNRLMPYLVLFSDGLRRHEELWFFDHELIPVDGQRPPPEGMTSVDLADYVETFIRGCRTRILGIGNEQYSGSDGQAFERMTPLELIGMAREEAQDGAVYMGMLDILLARLQKRFADSENS